MKKRVILFVEGSDNDHFWPLSVSRPPYLLRCGETLLWEKWVRRLQPAGVYFFTRSALAGMVVKKTGAAVNVREKWGDTEVWVLDGRWLIDAEEDFNPEQYPAECSLRHGEKTVGIRFDGANARQSGMIREWLTGDRKQYPDTGLRTAEIVGHYVDFLWDIVDFNPGQTRRDFVARNAVGPTQWPVNAVHEAAVIQGPEGVWIGKGAEVGPLAVLDARTGPIIIGREARINPHTYIEGPAVVGDGSQIHGGKIRGGTTIGPQCRIGGEVEASVFLGYANKYHDGFFGHGVVGEWANLGAMTTNSDLKNNYRPVRVAMPGRMVETGRIKVGSFLADHTKTGIGTLLPTGGTVGFAGNVFGGGEVAPKLVPEFTWGGGGRFVEYRLAEAKQTAAEMCRRRNIEFDEQDAQLFDLIFEQTKQQRDTFLCG